jgi:hypothetical protein
MFVTMVGSPHEGFVVVGPYTTTDEAEAAVNIVERHSNYWCWSFELNAGDEMDANVDANGTVIVFGGSIVGTQKMGAAGSSAAHTGMQKPPTARGITPAPTVWSRCGRRPNSTTTSSSTKTGFAAQQKPASRRLQPRTNFSTP